jgi:ABC-2 type transport system ATP-binding protein
MEKILEVSNLSKRYKKILAVDQLSFLIEKGKVYGLLGPNGSGKSTTLGIILEVVNRTKGKIEWFEGKLTPQEGLKKTGAIIERPNFYPYLSARQNLELVCKIKGIGTDKINEKLKLVRLYERKDELFKNFSLGMKQRLAIASSLLNEPELLILDEPTNGLDPKGIREIRDIIKQVAGQGKTIILASHLLDEVEKVCDHVIVLEKGRKIFDNRVSELINHQAWIEIECERADKLIDILKENPEIASIEKENSKLKIQTKMNGSELNKLLVKNGFYVNQLVIKKSSLEEMFINITQ